MCRRIKMQLLFLF